MDMSQTIGRISMTEMILDESQERPVDMDFVLPDYLPDVAAVLKCTMTPVVQSRQQSGDRMMLDGTTQLRVMYLDEGRRHLHTCEISQPFSASFRIPPHEGEAAARSGIVPGYVNCRATSPRRLDIHGAFNVRLVMAAETASEVISDIPEDGVYTKTCRVECSHLCRTAEKMFSVNEVTALGNGQPPAAQIIRTETVPIVKESRALSGKLMLKGDLAVRVLYVASDGETVACAEQELPFSQLIDVEGLEEDWVCDVRVETVSEDIRISVDQNGDGNLLTVNVKMIAFVECTCHDAADIITDAYSVHYPLETEKKKVQADRLYDIRREQCVIRDTPELPSQGIAEILHMWCDVSADHTECHDGAVTADGRLLIGMLTRETDGSIAYYERAGEFRQDFDQPCDKVTVTLRPLKTEYAMAGDRVEIRVTTEAVLHCFRTEDHYALTAVSANEKAEYPAPTASLRIYYADAGEDLWEVAKACRTSVQAVMAENDLEQQVLKEDAMLLLPLV